MEDARIVKLAEIVDRIQGHVSKILNIDRNCVHTELSFKNLGIGPFEKQKLLKSIKDDEVLQCDLITDKNMSVGASFILDIDELVTLIDETVNGEMCLNGYGMLFC